MTRQRPDAELTLAARAQLGEGSTLDDLATWLVDAHPDVHPVLLVKILVDPSGEDAQAIQVARA